MPKYKDSPEVRAAKKERKEKLREFLNPERAGQENVPVRPGLRPWNDNE